MPVLDFATASRLAGIALEAVQREYPNTLERFLPGQSPRAIHPAFYGCYDWHSAVHNHWLLVKLLKSFPDLPDAPAIRAIISNHFSAGNLTAEVANFNQTGQPISDDLKLTFNLPGQRGFEQPYGWAWLLQLAAELSTWDDPEAAKWLENLRPLAQKITGLFLNFLSEHSPPERGGQHRNTAFGLALALDYARLTGQEELEKQILRYALDFFAPDKNYPVRSEPGPYDFFSPALIEADLMQRVLPAADFNKWFCDFLPELEKGQPASLLQPVIVEDHNNPYTSHLDGLNLSRAWCLYNIAAKLPEQSEVRQVLLESANRHAENGLAHIFSGSFSSTGHWIGTFAVYLCNGR